MNERASVFQVLKGSPIELFNYIDGRFQPATGGLTIDNLAPAEARLINHIPRSTGADAEQAVCAAQQALLGPWRDTTPAQRADLLDAIADKIVERQDEFAALEALDTGKPIAVARSVDIPRAIANFRFFAGAVRHDETGFHATAPNVINYTLRNPLGVVALITPWNLPLYLLSWKTAPALAMGNTVVVKPSELTPLTAAALAEVIDQVGIPKGVFNLVQGYGHEIGQALCEHPYVNAISFTGGTATGAKVAATAAPQFKKLSLELGGKNPTLVFADADFDKAVAGAARAGFLNQGQICLCGSRIFVERPLYERFVEALVRTVGAMVVGAPDDEKTELGALISQAHRAKVEGYLQLAQEEGGRILTGGNRPDLPAPYNAGFYMRPTVIAGLSPRCRTATEEIFGPIVTVHPFDNEEEALREANAVRYGLAASLWTNDLSRAHRVAARLESGMVWVNTWLLRDLRVPFGGIKESGVGREGGKYSLEFFSESRNICISL